MSNIQWLAAPEDVDLQAWDAYFRGVRNQLVESWNDARTAYLTMRQVKESFGLPVVLSPEAAASGEPGWTPGDEQRILETQAIVELLTEWMDDALEKNTRRIAYDPAQGFVIEQLPSDTLRVVQQGGGVSILDLQGNPVPVTGTVGALPALAVVAIVGVAVVGVYFTVDAICDVIESTAEQETMRTLGDQHAKLVASGKATPEQAKKMTEAIYSGAKELTVAKGQAAAAEGSSGVQSTVRTVAWVALGITGLFFLAKVLPAFAGGRGGGGGQRLLTNPRDPGDDLSPHYPFQNKGKLGPGPLGESFARQQDWDCECENYKCVCYGISDETAGLKKTIQTDPKRKAAYNKMYRQWREARS